MDIDELLTEAHKRGASDLHITVGIPPAIRVDGRLMHMEGYPKLLPPDTKKLVDSLLNPKQQESFQERGELDFSYSIAAIGRFRCNVFRQRGSSAAVIRLISSTIRNLEELHMPKTLEDLAFKPRGLVLVTGPTGSGKSTTLAAMIDLINRQEHKHIITLEDPIEYLHSHKKSIVNQREIGLDSDSFAVALRVCLRQDPDIILVGEMRDMETISTAITAAETGHLVFATLHTSGAAQTIDRIIDVFPPHQQQQVRIQLAMAVQGIISQQLLPIIDGPGREVAVELMLGTPAIRNLIREGKTHQINSLIQTGGQQGMITMDSSLRSLYIKGKISYETALEHAVDKDNLVRMLQLN
ncbi:MAG: type IV pilus twitching motility protein PilT [bacterium]